MSDAIFKKQIELKKAQCGCGERFCDGDYTHLCCKDYYCDPCLLAVERLEKEISDLEREELLYKLNLNTNRVNEIRQILEKGLEPADTLKQIRSVVEAKQ